MVKSGLDKNLVEEIEGGIPRVSPYRLAAHLTCAFALFTGLVHTGLGVLQLTLTLTRALTRTLPLILPLTLALTLALALALTLTLTLAPRCAVSHSSERGDCGHNSSRTRRQ